MPKGFIFFCLIVPPEKVYLIKASKQRYHRAGGTDLSKLVEKAIPLLYWTGQVRNESIANIW